ncbi:MAG TPA: hypothetical protein VK425_00780 [Acidimicrobiales bacterium]|nr:hypothetical protein [Acidimicrobiales bacterium]
MANVVTEPREAERAVGSRRPLELLARVAGKSYQYAAGVHYLTLAAALGFWCWLGRGLWFFGDEWDFLVRRGLFYPPSSHRGIWFPHNEHWSTLPILLWRGIYNVFHLTSYWPYLAPLLLAHLAVVHLIWRVSLRAGAHPWLATVAAALLALLGAGASDILAAFQIGFVGAMLLGLLAMLLIELSSGGRQQTEGLAKQLAMPQRRPRRADALVSLLLLGSLMCSTVGDAMVAGAAVLLFARWPARRALAVLALPVVSYVVWFAALGRPSISGPRDSLSLNGFTTLPGYLWNEFASNLGQTFNLVDAGPAILVGLLAWLTWRLRPLWRESPVVLALAVSSLVFYALVGIGRDLTAGASSLIVSRYLYVAIALLIPFMAKLLSSATPWAAARLVVIGILALTILGEVGQARTWSQTTVPLETSTKDQLVATGQLLAEGTQDVSGPQSSPVGYYPSLSSAAVLDLERQGLLPHLKPTPSELANARAALAVGTWNGARTSLLARPLFSGRFALAGVVRGIATWLGNGCLEVGPETLSPPMQVWLRPLPGRGGASVYLSAAPALPNLTNYVYALLVPSRGQASTQPIDVEMPNDGNGYLSDNFLGGDLVLMWDIGSPLNFCGLAR